MALSRFDFFLSIFKEFLVDSNEIVCPWILDIFRKESLTLPLGQKYMKSIISKRHDEKKNVNIFYKILFTEKNNSMLKLYISVKKTYFLIV